MWRLPTLMWITEPIGNFGSENECSGSGDDIVGDGVQTGTHGGIEASGVEIAWDTIVRNIPVNPDAEKGVVAQLEHNNDTLPPKPLQNTLL